jgi:riboflavin transporter FmnP
MGVPRETVMKMLVPAIIPFNLIKAGVNSIFTFLLYESVIGVIKNR